MGATRRLRLWTVCGLLLLAPALSGCAGAVIGAGAMAGMAAYEDRSTADQFRDRKIQATLTARWLEKDQRMITDLGAEVYEGRVMLTGVAPDEAMRAEAVRIAWTVEGVRDVFNEIVVGDSGLMDFARDAWISTQLKADLVLDKEIFAVNYSIETVAGTVYLIGKAQSRAELDRVIAHARSLSYVRNVVNHVIVKTPEEAKGS